MSKKASLYFNSSHKLNFNAESKISTFKNSILSYSNLELRARRQFDAIRAEKQFCTLKVSKFHKELG